MVASVAQLVRMAVRQEAEDFCLRTGWSGWRRQRPKDGERALCEAMSALQWLSRRERKVIGLRDARRGGVMKSQHLI